ncbi:hypothetical protein [Streptomyces sp. NPDC001604]|uniref:hypothetical protein n=1 Tax=Streptomyces sp. NPDC001604 TaxID=3364593 RepID=UPI00368FB63A
MQEFHSCASASSSWPTFDATHQRPYADRQPPPGRLTVQADGEPAAADESGPPERTLDALAAEADGWVG